MKLTPRQIKPANGRRNAGFTLVELVVATAITLVLATMLISATSGILSAWNRSRGKLMSSNQAKLALDQLSEDLAGAFYRSDGNRWLAATILESNNPAVSVSNDDLRDDHAWIVSGANSARIKPRTADVDGGERSFELGEWDVAECRFGMAGVWLRFFTTKQGANSASNMSAPAAVGYQLVRRRVGSATSECSYILHRSLVTPENTFTSGYDLEALAYLTPIGTEGLPGSLVRPIASYAIANHVIDFGVHLYVREGGELRLIFPATPAPLGEPPSTGVPSDSESEVYELQLRHLSSSRLADPDDDYRNRFPDVVEVMLRVLSDEGASLIQNLEAGKISGDWWDIAEAHSTIYTRKIEVKGRGL